MAVSPAVSSRLIFLGQELRVVDQRVGALGKFAYRFIEDRIARFVIGGVNQDGVAAGDAKAEASLRVVQPHGIDYAIVKRETAFADVVKIAVSRHLGHIHRKIRIGHLIFDGRPEAATAVAGR